MPVEIVVFYTWYLGDSEHHCAECSSRAGRTLPLTIWAVLGRPPLHPFCACMLVFAYAEATLPDEDRPR